MIERIVTPADLKITKYILITVNKCTVFVFSSLHEEVNASAHIYHSMATAMTTVMLIVSVRTALYA